MRRGECFISSQLDLQTPKARKPSKPHTRSDGGRDERRSLASQMLCDLPAINPFRDLDGSSLPLYTLLPNIMLLLSCCPLVQPNCGSEIWLGAGAAISIHVLKTLACQVHDLLRRRPPRPPHPQTRLRTDSYTKEERSPSEIGCYQVLLFV